MHQEHSRDKPNPDFGELQKVMLEMKSERHMGRRQAKW